MSGLAPGEMMIGQGDLEPAYFGLDHANPTTPIGCGKDLLIIVWAEWDARADYYVPASRQLETAEDKFNRLAEKWHTETGMLSSTTEMAIHPAYQQIIGMGPVVVPLLLRELERAPDHWFWALRSITGADPVPEEDRGKVRKMAEAWVEWGRSQGYLT